MESYFCTKSNKSFQKFFMAQWLEQAFLFTIDLCFLFIFYKLFALWQSTYSDTTTCITANSNNTWCNPISHCAMLCCCTSCSSMYPLAVLNINSHYQATKWTLYFFFFLLFLTGFCLFYCEHLRAKALRRGTIKHTGM